MSHMFMATIINKKKLFNLKYYKTTKKSKIKQKIFNFLEIIRWVSWLLGFYFRLVKPCHTVSYK